jgi:uncharacterized membrane protein
MIASRRCFPLSSRCSSLRLARSSAVMDFNKGDEIRGGGVYVVLFGMTLLGIGSYFLLEYCIRATV